MVPAVDSPILTNPIALVAQSRVRPVFRQAPAIVGIGTLIALMTPALSSDPPLIFMVFAMWLGLVGGMVAYMYSIGQSQRQEARDLQGIEDAFQLHHDVPAGMRLEMMLAAPMYAHELRARAILLTATLLGRHFRYEEAIQVCTALLDENLLATPSQITVKLTRVMAMLHADRLYDADRAINELRKLIDRGDLPRDSNARAMLRWVEIFRDVKTGHYREAIEIFDASRDALRDALGHRAGEVYALLACAHDQLGDAEMAARLYRDATALWPLEELAARYEQVRQLSNRYQPTYAPSFAKTPA